MAMNTKVTILGIEFDHITESEMLEVLSTRLEHSQQTFVVTANPEIVMYAQKDQEYQQLINSATYVVADGIGIVFASRYKGRSLPERVPGFHLMIGLLQMADRLHKRVYFFGGSEAVVTQVIDNVRRDYPGIDIAGYHHGYIDIDDPKYQQQIQKAAPDIILVAMGFPKQEKWAHDYVQGSGRGIVMGVGGSFDVLAGVSTRAPQWMQSCHLEWLYRLIKQPTRYKRMKVIPQFIWQVITCSKRKGRS